MIHKTAAFNLILIISLLVPHFLNSQEVPFEFGTNYGFANPQESEFTRGVKKFRTSFNPQVQRITKTEVFPEVQTREYYLRAGVLDSERHLIGFTFGKFFFANMPLSELRSDSVITLTEWSFRLPYFMFTYHYSNRLRGRWNKKLKLDWEAGAGFGYITGSKWNVNGFSASRFQVLNYNINQNGRLGNIYRIDLGLRRNLWQGLHLRVGLSATYVLVGRFNGEVNDGNGSFYQLNDNSFIPLTSLAVLSSSAILGSPDNNLTGSALIKSRARINTGFTELKIGIGYRF